VNRLEAAAGIAELDAIARGHDPRGDFDGVIAFYAGRLLGPKVKGLVVLECGAASGEMTERLLAAAASVDVVEAAPHYTRLLTARFGGQIALHRCLVEEFAPVRRYEAIVMAGLLHHLADPAAVLSRARSWAAPGGRLFVTVPNMLSLHRRLGVAMGLSPNPYAASARNRRFRQPGRFDPTSLRQLLEGCGWRIVELTGFLVKPFPHDLMQQLDLSSALLDGLFELGRLHPDLAAQILVVAEPDDAGE
jgi:2-polyprenyl-3-methyl-5-hydroxy-6-metoxy-1,4-benzoquinol methylase